MQTNFPFLAGLKAPKNAPEDFVRRMKSAAQCLEVSITLHGLKGAFVATACGIGASDLSRYRKGRRELPKGFPVDRFCAVCGTNLLAQYIARHAPTQIERLAAELRECA